VDPWHYVPVLARKPGALRNGAPFKDWVLPAALERVRRKLAGSDDGDRQMVAILATVLTDGLPAVEAACAHAMSEGVHSSMAQASAAASRECPSSAIAIASTRRDALAFFDRAASARKFTDVRSVRMIDNPTIPHSMSRLSKHRLMTGWIRESPTSQTRGPWVLGRVVN
jgi:hypothetical protein